MLTNWFGGHDSPIWIQPRWCKPSVRGLFSFRSGGHSEPPFATLNTGLHVGDIPDAVIQNRQKCASLLGQNLDSFVIAEQVHGNRIAYIDASHRGRGAFSQTDVMPDVDGLVTNVRDITLTVFAADCVPILFYDPIQQVIGSAHSGWKGTLGHIATAMVHAMQTGYGSRPEDIQVSLGPSIRRCCYEVNEAVAEPMGQAFGRQVLRQRFDKAGKWLLSLQDCIAEDLQSVGVNRQNVEDCGVCTACRTSVLFSHRRENGQTGRLMGAICIHD